MGAESSSYQDLQLEEELPLPGERGWSIHDAQTKDGTRVSVFVHNKSSNVDSDLLQNAAKQLKTLRHPSILKFLALKKSSSGHRLVTEPVTPLEMLMENLTAAEVASGLYNILEALIFLHNRCGMCHNNVCVSSVYVGEDGSWRLGGMEYVCKSDEVSPEYLSRYRSMRDEASLPPEEKSGKIEASSDHSHARDAYSFGVLAEQFLESMTDLGDLTKTFELRIQDELLHPDPKNRPRLHTLLDDRLFSNGFLEVTHFLQHITLKSEVEKKDFFSLLIDKLHEMPTELVGSRLVKLLLSRFVLLDSTAVEYLIPHLLTPYQGKVREETGGEGNIKPLFSTSEFTRYVIPELFKIFHVRDAHIRLVLLSRFPQYAKLFNKTNLQNVILPQLLLGLRDVNDELVEASLRCLAELVPILGGDVVIGSSRAKIFSEGKPKFNNGQKNDGHGKAMKRPNMSPTRSQKLGAKDKIKEGKTLKELAKDHDREKKRKEAAQRTEERRKKREERAKQLESKTKERNRENISRSVVATQLKEGTTVINNEEEGTYTQSPGDKSKDGWSDWDQQNEEQVEEDEEEQQLSAMEDRDFDQEIEEELRAMDSSSREKYRDPGPPVTVDWSDAAKDTEPKLESRSRGMLKLMNKSKQSPPPKMKSNLLPENEWGDDEDWGYQDDAPRVTPRKAASPKVKGSRSRQGHIDIQGQQDGWIDDWGNEGSLEDDSSPASSPPLSESFSKQAGSEQLRNQKPEKDLGAEFDIMSIKVKPKKEKGNDPFDFFSDMEPVIPVKNPLAELIERSSVNKSEVISKEISENPTSDSHSKTDAENNGQNKLSFAVMDTNEDEVEVGWGDDDWGDPDGLLEDDLQT